jgi:DNA-binding transcriptional LysR family regulator
MLGGLLALLLADHAKIRIELTFTTRGDELVGDLVDIAIVIGRLPDSSLVTRRLGEATNRLYAAPSYVARRGLPRTFADLAKHDAIATRSIGGETRWEMIGPRGTTERVDVAARVVGDHLAFVVDAACAGLGIAQLPIWTADPRVNAGALVAVLPRYSAQMPLHVLTHGSRHVPRRVTIVRDFLYETMSGKCRGHGG